MSLTPSPGAQVSARRAGDLIASTTAKMTGKKRAPDRSVRRNSYNENDRQVRQLRRPVNGGQKAAGTRWRDAVLPTAREYELVGKQEGRRGPLSTSRLGASIRATRG